MSGGFTYLAGGPLRGPDDILVDEYLRQPEEHSKWAIRSTLLNHDWRVGGIIDSGKLARIVVDLDVLQDLDAASDKVSQIYLKLRRPAQHRRRRRRI